MGATPFGAAAHAARDWARAYHSRLATALVFALFARVLGSLMLALRLSNCK